MNCLRISALALAALTLSACGSKGSDGDAGPAGPAGPQGNVVAAPVLQFISPLPYASYRSRLFVVGENFSTDPLENVVLVGGHQATVLSADATTLEISDIVLDNAEQGNFPTLQLTVTVNNLTSNPLPIVQVPSGIQFPIGAPNPETLGKLTASGTSLISVDDDANIFRISVAGTRTYLGNAGLVGSTAVKAWERGTDIWVLEDNGVVTRYGAEGSAFITNFGAFFGATFVDGEFDVDGDLYALTEDGEIVAFDSDTHDLSNFFTVIGNPSTPGLTRIAGDLYVTDATNEKIVAVNIAAPGQVDVTTNGSLLQPEAVTNDGTDLFLWADGEIKQVSTAGAIATYSALDFAGTPTSLVKTGAVLYAGRDSSVFRFPDAATVEAWSSPSNLFGYSRIGDRTFIGTSDTCTAGDVLGDVLYELMDDGSYRRVTGKYCTTFYQDGTLGTSAILSADPLNGNILRTNVDTGAVTIFYDNVAAGSWITALGITTNPANGDVFFLNTLDNNTYSVGKLTAAGVLVDTAFITDTTNANGLAPYSMVVQGNRLVLNNIFSANLATAPLTGGDVTELGNANLTVSVGMSLAPDGRVLIPDLVASQFLFLGEDDSIEVRAQTFIQGYSFYEDVSGLYFGFDFNGTYSVVLP